MIIDVHTHYGFCFQQRDGLDPSRWLAELHAHGIDGAVVCLSFDMRHMHDARACHDDLAQVVANSQGRLTGFGTVHPFADANFAEEAERVLKMPEMRGIKLHPWLQGFNSLGGEQMRRLCDICADFDAPILFHDGTSNVSMPSQIAKLAEAHPDTTFILGHGGLIHLWRQAAEAAALYDNIYITLCGPHPAAARHICNRVPTERILWGSDFGFGFSHCIGYRKRIVDLLNLAPSAYNAVMGGNAARLLKWWPRSRHSPS